jgi:hypothetical protein
LGLFDVIDQQKRRAAPASAFDVVRNALQRPDPLLAKGTPPSYVMGVEQGDMAYMLARSPKSAIDAGIRGLVNTGAAIEETSTSAFNQIAKRFPWVGKYAYGPDYENVIAAADAQSPAAPMQEAVGDVFAPDPTEKAHPFGPTAMLSNAGDMATQALAYTVSPAAGVMTTFGRTAGSQLQDFSQSAPATEQGQDRAFNAAMLSAAAQAVIERFSPLQKMARRLPVGGVRKGALGEAGTEFSQQAVEEIARWQTLPPEARNWDQLGQSAKNMVMAAYYSLLPGGVIGGLDPSSPAAAPQQAPPQMPGPMPPAGPPVDATEQMLTDASATPLPEQDATAGLTPAQREQLRRDLAVAPPVEAQQVPEQVPEQVVQDPQIPPGVPATPMPEGIILPDNPFQRRRATAAAAAVPPVPPTDTVMSPGPLLGSPGETPGLPGPVAPVAPVAPPVVTPVETAEPEIAALQAAYDEAKAKLDAIGPEPTKPSNERQRFGKNGRQFASPEAVAEYDAAVKAHNSWRSKYSKLKKAEVEASNRLFRARNSPTADPLGAATTPPIPPAQGVSPPTAVPPPPPVDEPPYIRQGLKRDFDIASATLRKNLAREVDGSRRQVAAVYEVLDGEPPAVQDAIIQLLQKEFPAAYEKASANAPIRLAQAFARNKPVAPPADPPVELSDSPVEPADTSPEFRQKLALTEKQNNDRATYRRSLLNKNLTTLRKMAQDLGLPVFGSRVTVARRIAESKYPDQIPLANKSQTIENTNDAQTPPNPSPVNPVAAPAGDNDASQRGDPQAGSKSLTGKSKAHRDIRAKLNPQRADKLTQEHSEALTRIVGRVSPGAVITENDDHIEVKHRDGSVTKVRLVERVSFDVKAPKNRDAVVQSFIANNPGQGGPTSLADFKSWTPTRQKRFIDSLADSVMGLAKPEIGEIEIKFINKNPSLDSVYFEELNHVLFRRLPIGEVRILTAYARMRGVSGHVGTVELTAKLAEDAAKGNFPTDPVASALGVNRILTKMIDGSMLSDPARSALPDWNVRPGRRPKRTPPPSSPSIGPRQQEVVDRIREEEAPPPPISKQIKDAFSKPPGFTVDWLDKMRRDVQDHLWPLVKAMRSANADVRAGVPEMLLRLYAGVGGKIDSQFRSGLRSADGKILTDSSGAPLTVGWLLENLDYSSDTAMRESMRDMFALGVAERTVEKHTVREKEYTDAVAEYHAQKTKALAGRAALKAAKGKRDVIAAAKALRDNSRELRKLRATAKDRKKKMSLPISGIGAARGVTDFEQAKDVIKEMRANPAKYARAIENLRRYRKFGNAILDYMRDKGFIDAKQRADIDKENQFYINFKRVLGEWEEETAHAGGLGSVLPKWKGSNREIDNPLVSLLIGAEKMIRAADKNFAFAEFAGQLGGGHKDIGERIDTPKTGPARPKKYVAKSRYLGDTIKIRVKGEQQEWKFHPDVLRAMNAISEFLPEQASGLFNIPGKLTRELVTQSPGFMVRNIIRDAVQRGVVSESASKPWDILKGMSRKEIDDLAYFGGSQEVSDVSGRRSEYWRELKKKMSELRGDKGTLLARAGAPFKVWNALRLKSEQVGRVAEFRAAYKQAIAEGKSDYEAGMIAAYKSRELLDFSVAGSIIRSINRFAYIPFANAQVQGATRTLRAFRDHPKATSARWSLYVLAPTMIAYAVAASQGEEKLKEYRSLPAWRRDMFWNYKIGSVWVTIPKPYEMGVAASGVERLIDMGMGNKRAFAGYDSSVKQATVGLGDEFITGPWRAFIENWTNYSFFFDRNIVPPWETGLAINLRDTSQASRIGKAMTSLASGIGWEVDPRKFDNIIRSTGGGLGGSLMDLSNLGREDSQPARIGMTASGLMAASPGGSSSDIKGALDAAARLGDDSRVIRDLRTLLGVANSSPTLAERDIYLKQARQKAEEIQRFYDDMGDEVMEFQELRRSADRVEQKAEKLSGQERADYLRDNREVIYLGRQADRYWQQVALLRQQISRNPERRDEVYERIRTILSRMKAQTP